MRYETGRGSDGAKFWEIELTGKEIRTRSGKVGSTGHMKYKQLAGVALARKEHDRLVKGKLKEGYVAVDRAAAEQLATAASHGKSDASLEKAIRADLDGTDAYLVYADWLQGQGDPRGELITLQHARGPVAFTESAKKKRKKHALDKPIEKLLSRHAEAFFGALAPYTEEGNWGRASFHVDWHLGFFKGVRVSGDSGTDVSAGWMLERLWPLPSAKYLRELSIGALESGDMPDYQKMIALLVKAREQMPHVRSIHLGDYRFEEWDVRWSFVGAVAKLVKAFPNLHRLALHGRDIALGTLAMPELRELDLYEDTSEDFGKALAKATLPKLETLRIKLGPNGGDLPKLEAIFDGKFPKLRTLVLDWYDPTKKQLEALCTGKTLAKLDTLVLSSAALTDTKAAVIVGHAKRFAHLRSIDLDNNLLDKTVPAIRKLCADVRLGVQQGYDDVYEW